MITSDDFSFLIVTPAKDPLRLIAVIRQIRNYYPNNEIVVVYDNIKFELKKYIQTYNIKEIYTNKRVYIGGGYNLALQNASNKCFAFLHDDTYIYENFIENLIEHIDETTFANFSLIEPNLYNNNRQDSILNPIGNFGRDSISFDYISFEKFCKHHIQSIPPDKITTPSIFGGFFMCGFIKPILDIGGFDEYITPYFSEDADLILRMILKGYKFVHITTSLVYHMGSLTSRSDNEEYVLSETTTKNKFLKKWRVPFELIKENTIKNQIPLIKFNVKIDTSNIKDYYIINYINNISDNMNDIVDYSTVTIESDPDENDIANLNILPYLAILNKDKPIVTIGNLTININPKSFSPYQIMANI
jgi:GT2 family glycosyltransferase